MLTEEQVRELVKSAVPGIQKALIDGAKESVKEEMRWKLSEAVSEELKTFIQAEIAPAVKEYLLGEKATILASAIKSCDAIADLIRESLIKEVTEKLGQSWQRKKLVEALFG